MYRIHFSHQPEALTPAIGQLLGYLQQLPFTITEENLFKAQYIVTELLTNALKHSTATESELIVEARWNELYITKADEGPPLQVLTAAPKKANSRVLVSQDVMYRLYAWFDTKNQIRFEGEEVDGVILVDEISGHFGLQIITRMADEFVYRHQSPHNIFKVGLKLS